MSIKQYETSTIIDTAFVIAGFWYGVAALLCQSAIIFIVPKLSVKVLDTAWYKHSNALRYAMTVWIVHWIASFFEVFGMSNYLIHLTNYSIICTMSIKCQAIMVASATAGTFLCFVSILEDCFQSTALQYSPKIILWLKMLICIPMIVGGILFNIFAIKGKVYAVNDDQNLLFCENDPSTASAFRIILVIFGTWYLLTEIVTLSLFLSRMRKVMSHGR